MIDLPRGFHALTRLHAAVAAAVDQALHDELDPQHLSCSGWLALDALATHHPDGVRMGVLAEGLNRSQSGLTRIADTLEKARLVERHKSFIDQRGRKIHLTDLGRQVRDRCRPVVITAVRDTLTNPEVFATATTALGELLNREPVTP